MKKKFVGTKPYRNTFSATIAIFCSDERFSQTAFEFLKTFLGIKRCDLMIYPGGPQFIAAGNEDAFMRMKILIAAHAVKRIVLLSHTQCGYYASQHPGMTEHAIYDLQITDIRTAADEIRRLFPDIGVETYYMGLENGHLSVIPVVQM